MDDIIKSIIDIDRGASKKLEDAEKEKLKIISGAKAEEEKIVQEAIENSKRELERIENEEQQKAEEKIAQLENEKNAKIAAMRKSFDENSEKWCSEIFRAVISGTDS